MIAPCLTASIIPCARSALGMLATTSGSATTRFGAWNAPTRFFPPSTSTPVFPPIDASIIATRLVGTCTTGIPLMYVAATKPPRSPVTPPPIAIRHESRPNPAWRRRSVNSDHVVRFFSSFASLEREEVGAQAGILQLKDRGLSVERGHVGVGDQSVPMGRCVLLQKRSQRAEQATAHKHLVWPRGSACCDSNRGCLIGHSGSTSRTDAVTSVTSPTKSRVEGRSPISNAVSDACLGKADKCGSTPRTNLSR